MPDHTPRTPLPEPVPIGTMVARGMFAYRSTEDGKPPVPVERRATCECGREFTQSLMAPTELAALERMGHIATFMRQVPDCFVPVHCPPCERGQLTLQSRRDDTARIGTATPTLPDRRAS